jgi:hypothetical protein
MKDAKFCQAPSSFLNDESIKITDPKILFSFIPLAGGIAQPSANTSNSPPAPCCSAIRLHNSTMPFSSVQLPQNRFSRKKGRAMTLPICVNGIVIRLLIRLRIDDSSTYKFVRLIAE